MKIKDKLLKVWDTAKHLSDKAIAKLEKYYESVKQPVVTWATILALVLALNSCGQKTSEDYRKDLGKAQTELSENQFERIQAEQKYPVLQKNYAMYYKRGIILDNMLNTSLQKEQAEEYLEQYNEIVEHLVEIWLEAVELEKIYLWLLEQANLKEADIKALQEYLKGKWWSGLTPWWRPKLPNWSFPGLPTP